MAHRMLATDLQNSSVANKSNTFPSDDDRIIRFRQTIVISNSGKNAESQLLLYNTSDLGDPMRQLLGQFVNITITLSVQVAGGSVVSSKPEWDFVSSGMFSYLQYDARDFPSKSSPQTMFTNVLSIRGILVSIPQPNAQIQWGTFYYDVNSNNSTSVAFNNILSIVITGENGFTRVI